MAWGENAKVRELEIENAVLKREIELQKQQLVSKDQQIVALHESLDRAYEALTAKEAPEAYRDRQSAQPPRELTSEERRMRALGEANRQLLIETESDLFKSADDMVAQLQRVLGGPTLKSLHGDDES